MSSTLKFVLFWMTAALILFLFWNVSARIQKNDRRLSYSDFVTQLERGHVQEVTILGSNDGSTILGKLDNGQAFRTFAPPQAGNLVDTLLAEGVEVNAQDRNSASWLGHIISWTPIVIMIAFLIFFMRQMQGRTHVDARIWGLLSGGDEDLSETQISSKLSGVSDRERRDALYRMLREGTIVLTADRKYRVKTVD
jgi:cell division protease FtsH